MAEEVKKYPKKLRDRETIMVDEQIARWRKMLKKKGLVTGKNRARQLKDQARRLEKDKTEVAIKTGKLNFFGGDEE